MSPDDIRHFLITLDPDTDETTVEEFGTDYRAALVAYAEAERTNGINPRLNTVLISADSLETIKQTHSSYFKGNARFKELLEH
jgi:peptide methionine sulfoxide reductase MsrA